MTRVGVIDLGISNLGSLGAALTRLGVQPLSIIPGEKIPGADALILPGVGSFSEAMKRLTSSELNHGITAAAHSGVPILGICLGMQLLSERGFEGGETEGLGLIPGQAVRMSAEDSSVRLPHIGWNSVFYRESHPVFVDIAPGADFYFVHSYQVVNVPEENVLGTTTHGTVFCSSTTKENVVGVQFHPEKSQISGLRLLRNFIRWAGSC